MKKQVKLVAIVLFIAANSLMAQNITVIPDKPEMIFIEGGAFTMGGGSNDHNTIYSVSKHLVTVEQGSCSIRLSYLLISKFFK